MTDYFDANRAMWDERAPVHAGSAQYQVEQFVSDPGHLSEVVTFDRPLLGDIAGLDGVHLQCHIGTDTLSLSRLGARMTGLDFSGQSLEQARSLAQRAGADIGFHRADVHDAVAVLGAERFDLVYTGIGALCWLPEIRRWADVVAGLLRPGGRLFVREGHPMLWALDEQNLPVTPRYSYFETAEPLTFDEPGSYVDIGDTVFTHTVSHSWNHSLGEIITALLDVGLTITGFAEHQSVPWDALPGQMTMDDGGEWRLTEHPECLAASYTLQAVKGRYSTS